MAKKAKIEVEEPLEKKLWKAADKLRKNMDAAEYKHVALGLTFLKYISDAFKELYNKLKEGRGDYDGADPEDKNEYVAEKVFYVPPSARWTWLQGRAKLPTIGKDIDDAMDAIEKDNPSPEIRCYRRFTILKEFKEMRTVLAILLFVFNFNTYGQTNTEERIKLFINCQDDEFECFNDFVVSELSYFLFVRDRAQSDVEILVIEQVAPTGGRKYTLEFNGLNRFKSLKVSDTINIKPAETEFSIRNILLKSIKINLFHFIFQSTSKNHVDIIYPSDTINLVSDPEETKDKWKNWIFMLGMEGNFYGETNRKQIEQTSYFAILRVTNKYKFIFDSWYETRFNSVRIDSDNLKAVVHSYGAETNYVHSVNSKFSAGGFLSAHHDNFSNINLQLRLSPAIEYNFYNYSENASKQLRLGYQAGFKHFQYLDTTVYDKTKETRPFHQLSLVAYFARPWGSINSVLLGDTFLDNLRQNRFTARLNLSIRLAEGLNFFVDGSTSLVNNQISLLKKELPEEVYLLNGAMLPTRFLYEASLGLSFTFGSSNKSIINPRFENINE